MSDLFKACFWRDAGDRAVTTAAQVAATMLTVNAFGQHIEWTVVAYGSAVAAMYSLLTTIARRGGGTQTPLPSNGVVAPVAPLPKPEPPTPTQGPNQWR